MGLPEAGTVSFGLALSAFICLGTNILGFLIAVVTKTHKITDLIGCGTFAISAWATYATAANGNNVDVGSGYRPLWITIGVTFWSVRLAGFLFYRILQTKTDKRFDGFYNKPGEPWLTGPTMFPIKLLGFWTLQALWEWVVLLPVTAAQADEPTQEMGAWGWIGFVMYMLLFVFESGADFQKDWFKRQPGNKSEFVRTGFYYWCQFPNYFGEIAIWWVMFFWAGFPKVFISHPWIIVSPLFTTVLLRWGSGVATLAASQYERYGPREDYRQYVATTPVLLPFMKPFYINNEAKPFEKSPEDDNLAPKASS